MKAMGVILMKMAVLVKEMRFALTATGVLRVFREIRFYLHKEFRAAGIRL